MKINKKGKIIIGIGVIIFFGVGFYGIIYTSLPTSVTQKTDVSSNKVATSTKSTSTVTKTKDTASDNAKSEYDSMVNSMNKIGTTNLTDEQLTSFINQFMRFIDNKNSDYYNDTIKELVILKIEYMNRYTGAFVVNNNLLVREPKIGMTKNEVMALTEYIKPTDINKTTTKYGTREQYVYYNSYLYFEDGKLTAVQN